MIGDDPCSKGGVTDAGVEGSSTTSTHISNMPYDLPPTLCSLGVVIRVVVGGGDGSGGEDGDGVVDISVVVVMVVSVVGEFDSVAVSKGVADDSSATTVASDFLLGLLVKLECGKLSLSSSSTPLISSTSSVLTLMADISLEAAAKIAFRDCLRYNS